MFADSRDYQIVFLATFLGLGITTRDWSIRPELILVLIITCCLTQLVLTIIFRPIENPILALKSALITSLGLALLLRADRVSTMILAGMLAIASKFVFTSGNKHWFNPANFGIITALILTPDAWISPGQWGDKAHLRCCRTGERDAFKNCSHNADHLRGAAVGWTTG